ncbi:hypothetical protein J2X42_002430 [Arthrobacter sp. BE255]|nr:hypothetical protein [Arthrobacter sp. BE255]
MDPSCASGMVNCREYWMNAGGFDGYLNEDGSRMPRVTMA